jgi:intracellular septation protein
MSSRTLLVHGLAEFVPVVTFLIASEFFGFTAGLVWLIATATIVISIEWFTRKHVPRFALVATATVLLFGGLSIGLNDPFFIIVKDTLYALSFGLALLVGLLMKRSYLEVLFGEYFAITDRGWRRLTYRWMVFFFLLAFMNEAARVFLTPELWVYYKFCSVFMTWVFGFYQFTLARDERLPSASPWGFKIHT